MDCDIRPIKKDEIMLLTEFLYEAIFQKDTQNLVPRTILQEPSIWIYIDKFGTKKDDHCLVAVYETYLVGAVWTRCINAFGHLKDQIPEIAISVYPQYRGKGIGTKLMQEMLCLLRANGYSKVSLAVQKENYAIRMYEKVGFKVVCEKDEEYLMCCSL